MLTALSGGQVTVAQEVIPVGDLFLLVRRKKSDREFLELDFEPADIAEREIGYEDNGLALMDRLGSVRNLRAIEGEFRVHAGGGHVALLRKDRGLHHLTAWKIPDELPEPKQSFSVPLSMAFDYKPDAFCVHDDRFVLVANGKLAVYQWKQDRNPYVIASDDAVGEIADIQFLDADSVLIHGKDAIIRILRLRD